MKLFKKNGGIQRPADSKIPVILALLTQEQTINSRLMQFIIHCLGRNSDPNSKYEFGYTLVENYRPVEYARNLASKEFLRVTENRQNAICWWIDSDMVPPHNYERQLEIDADMGAGRVYGIQNGQLFTCLSRKMEDGEFHPLAISMEATGITHADASGTGGLWVKRKVMADKRMWLAPDEPILFQTLKRLDGSTKLSEDLDFTSRATALGYTIRADVDVKWEHYKSVDLRSLEGGVACTNMYNDLARGAAEAAKKAAATAGPKVNHPFKPKGAA